MKTDIRTAAITTHKIKFFAMSFNVSALVKVPAEIPAKSLWTAAGTIS